MKGYIISYDLNSPGQNYSGLHDAIKKFKVCDGYMKYLDSTYVVISQLSAKEIFDILYQYLDNSDRILIIEVIGHWHAQLPDDAYEWLHKHLP